MKYILELRDLAIFDIKEAYEWYELQKENLGEEFLDELELILEKIEAHPSWFPKRETGYHSIFTNRFPYEIVYRIKGNRILIMAVYHAKRDPSKKLRR